MMTRAYVLLFGVVLGWSARSVQQTYQELHVLQATVANTFTLADVLVVKKQGQDKYLLQTAAHQPFTLKFCAERIPEWEELSKLKVLIYEQRPDCASISMKTGKLGYLVYRDDQGEPQRFVQEAEVRYAKKQ